MIEFAKKVLEKEMAGIARAADSLDRAFADAVALIRSRKGRVVVCGVGKSGHIGRKIAATLASTGQPALFVHPTEAAHGDAGMITPDDVCLMLSHSGASRELFDMIPGIRRMRVPIVSITGNGKSGLAYYSDVSLKTGVNGEACPYNLAPTTSSTVTLALGDALALTLMHEKGLKEKDFASLHPGGNLGRKLMDITDKVDAVTKIGENRIAMGGIQPAPKSVKIELTARCNLRCKFCALRTRKREPQKDMSFDFFKRITTDMRMCGVEEIGLFYLGESFMNPGLLIEACHWVARVLKFPWVFLTSNGTLAKEEHVNELYQAGLNSLKWSVNCSTLEQYRDICGGTERGWRALLENIRNAWEIRNVGEYDTLLSASSIRYDATQHDDMQDFLKESVIPYVDKHYWLPMYSMSMYREKIQQDTGYVSSIGNMGRIDELTQLPNRSPLPCWAAFTEGHVRVDGGLSACCFGADARFDMGKLDGTNFMSQWNSPQFQKLREAQLATMDKGPDALINTPCRVCVAWGDQ